MMFVAFAHEPHRVFEHEAGDELAEKTALSRLGLAHARLRRPAQALRFYEEALALAHALGDRHHEADLLWYTSIQNAELGQHDHAIAGAESAIDLLGKMGSPQAEWLADYLEKYRGRDAGSRQGEPGEGGNPESRRRSSGPSLGMACQGQRVEPQVS